MVNRLANLGVQSGVPLQKSKAASVAEKKGFGPLANLPIQAMQSRLLV